MYRFSVLQNDLQTYTGAGIIGQKFSIALKAYKCGHKPGKHFDAVVLHIKPQRVHEAGPGLQLVLHEVVGVDVLRLDEGVDHGKLVRTVIEVLGVDPGFKWPGRTLCSDPQWNLEVQLVRSNRPSEKFPLQSKD